MAQVSALSRVGYVLNAPIEVIGIVFKLVHSGHLLAHKGGGLGVQLVAAQPVEGSPTGSRHL